MIYTGTIKQVAAIEDFIESTKNYTRLRDGKRPDVDGMLKDQMPTAYTVLYEVYFDPAAIKYAQDPDKWFSLIGFKHATMRFAYFHRDDKAEVKLSPHKMPLLLATYPDLCALLAPLTYLTNQRKVLTYTHRRG